MKTAKLLMAGALVFALSAGLAQAKIPVPPMDDAAKAKAEEKKVKDADAAKKAGEQLAKAQDRVAERYKKSQVKGGKPAAAAKGAKPAAATKK
ncbi:MAG: formate dehydrogenase [Betaproteobacteria bacterium]|nr:formate dehydrogenase [Betaproteobacteria bacterium]